MSASEVGLRRVRYAALDERGGVGGLSESETMSTSSSESKNDEVSEDDDGLEVPEDNGEISPCESARRRWPEGGRHTRSSEDMKVDIENWSLAENTHGL